jgi:hypothetical protein
MHVHLRAYIFAICVVAGMITHSLISAATSAPWVCLLPFTVNFLFFACLFKVSNM